MGEGAVGLCHLVSVFATLHGCTQTVRCVQDLVGKTLGHGVLTTLAGEGHQPTQCEGGGTAGANLNRNLVGSATNTAGTNLKSRLNVVESLLQGEDRIGAGLLAALLQSAVNDALCGGLLTVKENLVNQLGDENVAVNWILD